MEYLTKLLEPLKFFIDLLKNHPWQTFLCLFLISAFGNIYQYMDVKKDKTGEGKSGVTALMVYDSITTVKVLPIMEDKEAKYNANQEANVLTYSDALANFYEYAKKSEKVINRIGKNKALTPDDKKRLEDDLIDLFKNSK